MTNHDAMIAKLDETGNYKILRRLVPGACVQAHDGSPVRHGIVLDCETTGLDPRGISGAQPDEIIELAMLKFAFTEDFKVVEIADTFQSFREPGKPIPDAIQKLTGIVPSMVEGHAIDVDRVADFVAGVDLVIAHNARFDRKFCENLHHCFQDVPWACSWSELDWSHAGGGRLNYIVNAAGMFHEGHRAQDDCGALLEMLARPLGQDGVPALGHLVEAAGKSTARLWARGAPFEKKDVLKSRGYRWNNGDNGGWKAWFADVPEHAEPSEIQFLRDTIFGSGWAPTRQIITARDRFSDRC